MKQGINQVEWNTLSPVTKEAIRLFKLRKGYTNRFPILTFGQALELFMACSPDFHHDGFLHGTFNNTLEDEEIQMGWDGSEPMDIIIYRLDKAVQKRYAIIAKYE